MAEKEKRIFFIVIYEGSKLNLLLALIDRTFNESILSLLI